MSWEFYAQGATLDQSIHDGNNPLPRDGLVLRCLPNLYTAWKLGEASGGGCLTCSLFILLPGRPKPSFTQLSISLGVR